VNSLTTGVGTITFAQTGNQTLDVTHGDDGRRIIDNGNSGATFDGGTVTGGSGHGCE